MPPIPAAIITAAISTAVLFALIFVIASMHSTRLEDYEQPIIDEDIAKHEN